MESGNIIVIETESPFQKVSKESIFDTDIDCTTLGVYVKLLAFGKQWKLNIKGLYSLFNKKEKTISENKIRESIIKLEQEGYIRREPCYNESHRWSGWNYFIYETRVPEEQRTRAGMCGSNTEGKTDFEVLDNTENGQHQKRTTPKTDLSKTGKSIYKEYKEIENIKREERIDNNNLSSSFSSSQNQNTIPQIEDVYDYYDSMHYQYTSPDRFFHYYKKNGWVAKGEPLVNWKAMFDKWEERARQKAEEANNGEYRQTSGGSGNNSESEEERERRYHKQAAEMQKKVIEAGWWPDDYPNIYANGT